MPIYEDTKGGKLYSCSRQLGAALGLTFIWCLPNEVCFNRQDIEWLFGHWGIISIGEWPPEPRESGYSEVAGVVILKGKTKGRRWGRFEKPCDIAAELEMRMRLAGEDGSVLRDLYILGFSEEEAARMRRITEDTLRRRRNRVIRMMTGRDRKVKNIPS